MDEINAVFCATLFYRAVSTLHGKYFHLLQKVFGQRVSKVYSCIHPQRVRKNSRRGPSKAHTRNYVGRICAQTGEDMHTYANTTKGKRASLFFLTVETFSYQNVNSTNCDLFFFTRKLLYFYFTEEKDFEKKKKKKKKGATRGVYRNFAFKCCTSWLEKKKKKESKEKSLSRKKLLHRK
ncbi:hypothetical protein POVWA2_059680 [Plasmodium ovale wallikeri]|uniref:Uncharacterized protein n=1 Tax=Plasmodium ovale wallikeri TaxID=864142 RepID=A0A1A8YN27_PLAOA|nr:hypothetical protein POVWA1_014870 [Plasmodium ovale wallikeri]SBT50189.1 hypothetical protein POVWA2_059680 [Plasmodium ovale wallikeri]